MYRSSFRYDKIFTDLQERFCYHIKQYLWCVCRRWRLYMQMGINISFWSWPVPLCTDRHYIFLEFLFVLQHCIYRNVYFMLTNILRLILRDLESQCGFAFSNTSDKQSRQVHVTVYIVGFFCDYIILLFSRSLKITWIYRQFV